ncbi:MAG: ABC transporter ATP-binding protein/permease [Cytophagales bacterium]|nr:ABC transporter ATP-binding protein/permease [Cytophagales bacterium]MDW8384129.1 ABC transporter ATP-binding protein [Flammeovirgaceae bacterium]
MRIYWRVISLVGSIHHYLIPFFLFTSATSIFGVANFALLIPLLDLLFGSVQTHVSIEYPIFRLDVNYLKELFYYYFFQIMVHYGKMSALQFVCAVVVIGVFLANFFAYLAIRINERLRAHVSQCLRENLFKKILSLDIGFYSEQRKGDIMSRFTSDVYEIEGAIASALASVAKEPFQVIIYFAVLFSLSVKLTFFTLVIIPLSGGVIALVVKSLRKDSRNIQHTLGMISSMLDEAISGLRVIKGFNAERFVQHKFFRQNHVYTQKLISLGYKRELAAPFSEVSGVSIVVGILLYGGSLVLSQSSELSASQFVTYLIIFSQVLRPIKSMAGTISSVQRCVAAGERIFSILDAQPTIVEKSNPVVLETFQKEIRFENVSFAYGEKNVLEEISFTVEKGQTVAIVGQSGSGKSTIADLIPRFYDVKEGAILIDGIDIREISLYSLRKQMGIVTQESILFNDTIFNNIAFGAENATLEQVMQAAKVANAHEFIMQTENGYYTIIGDRGLKLSGGQRQRLSIARAVFKNPPILILDEATSALDTESEKLVQEALNALMKNRTSVVIAHRLSTIQNAHKIIVLEKGRIVESGTHQELIQKQKGRYRELRMLQETF